MQCTIFLYVKFKICISSLTEQNFLHSNFLTFENCKQPIFEPLTVNFASSEIPALGKQYLNCQVTGPNHVRPTYVQTSYINTCNNTNIIMHLMFAVVTNITSKFSSRDVLRAKFWHHGYIDIWHERWSITLKKWRTWKWNTCCKVHSVSVTEHTA